MLNVQLNSVSNSLYFMPVLWDFVIGTRLPSGR